MNRIAILLAMLAGLWSGALHAHAVLVGADPADGASLAASPPHVALRFNEDITLIDARVIDDGGAVLALPHAPMARDGAVIVPLPVALRVGTYLVIYRVVSLDSHPVSGTSIFAIGGAADRAAIDLFAPRDGNGGRVMAMILRALLLAWVTLVAGGIIFARVVGPLPARLRRGLAIVALAGIAVALANLTLRAFDLAGTDIAAVLQGATWRPVFAVPLGGAMILASFGFALAAWGLGRDRATAALLGAAALIISLPLSGHAAATSWWAFAAATIHAALACFWIGAFLPLIAVLRGPGAAAVVRRFSRRAMIAVPVLLGAGIALAIVQVSEPAMLIDSAYGRWLLAKLALVAGLIARAAWNRRLTAGLDATAPRLARAIGVEIALALGVLALTAGLGGTPPRTAIVDHADHHDHAAMMAAMEDGDVRVVATRGMTAAIELTPARAGINRLEITLADTNDAPLSPREVTVALTHPALGAAPIMRRLSAEAPGRYVLEGPEFALAGTWRLRAEVLVSDFVLETIETELVVR